MPVSYMNSAVFTLPVCRILSTLLYILYYFLHSFGEPSHNTERLVGTAKTDEVDIINGTRPHEVSYLDPDNFDEFISSHKNVMIMFYAPCKYGLIFALNFSIGTRTKCFRNL